MARCGFSIYGGAAVRCYLKRPRVNLTSVFLFLILAMVSSSAFAQGSIFGTVANTDATTPANGEISFVGFLDDTDEEIRIESSSGAGYDAGNWFDDFQNYLTEAPGNPYDFYFSNVVNGESFHLAGLIPSNSFHQENIVLGLQALPATPTGLTGSGLSASAIALSWNGQPGMTYHVYRRFAVSNGSLFRIDNQAGDLANVGVADSAFVDNSTDGASAYDYLIIAEDGSGIYSAHSAVITVDAGAIVAPIIASLDPVHGTAVGGTTVNVYGSGFDPAGATVQFGALSAAATVISSNHLTVITPAGAVGPVDVSVTNLATAQTSNVLIGGYTYDANTAPVLAAIADQTVIEGDLLTFVISATDVDGDIPIMSSSALPGAATFVGNPDGTGLFSWQTDFTNAGIYSVTFYATDGLDAALVDSETISITVTETGNQVPVLAAINDTSIAEGGSLLINVSATDADGEIPSMSATNLPANAIFVDNADGTGLLTFNPDLTQSGIYLVTFKAIDAALALDSAVVQITVTETNQSPVLALPGDQSVTENILLDFVITASDGDGVIPVLSAANLPTGALFVDSLNGAGLLTWTPTFVQAGPYDITFYATDGTDTDSGAVNITVIDAGNQAPVLAAIGAQTISEGLTLNLGLSASDPDGTTPTLAALNLPTNAAFVDNGDGTGSFDFSPAFSQAGVYTVIFIADDGLLADTEWVDITVNDAGNQAPIFVVQADTTINEGGVLLISLTANDPDGGGLFPALSVNTSLNNYTFVDNRDGTGIFNYSPNFISAGVDTVQFFATDFGTPQQTASMTVIITTNDVNQAPVWSIAGPYGVSVGDTLRFTVNSSDSTDPNQLHIVFLSALNVPTNGTFKDNGDGSGLFTFAPTAAQAGIDTVTFLAVDQGTPQLSATLPVVITVVTENIWPILDPIGPQTVLEGDIKIVNVSASDPDGPAPQLSTGQLPLNSTFVDNGDGTGSFTFFPSFVQAGLHSVTVKAYDGFATAKEVVLIQVYEAGDQNPVFDPLPTASVIENDTLFFAVSASDPDELPIALTVTGSTLPSFVSFIDSGNGVGVFAALPSFTDAGAYDIEVIASDGTLADTITITLDVIEAGNQLPVIAPLPDIGGKELIPIAFNIWTLDVDGSDFPIISGENLPVGASVSDNRDGSGLFKWTPTDLQAGTWDITILAEDFDFPGVFDTDFVSITVVDTNRVPFIVTSGSRSVFEGDTLEYTVFATDPDGTIPILGARIDGEVDLTLPNAVFFDSANGIGVLTFTPDYTQGGISSEFYFVRFYAIDADDPTLIKDATAPVQIEVINRNAPPEVILLSGPGPFTITEGETLSFSVGAEDLDAVSLPVLSALNLPPNATFSGVQSFGTFTFTPGFTQAGTHFVTFRAVDDHGDTDEKTVQINVLEAGNQIPYFTSTVLDTVNVAVNQTSQVLVRALDPDMDAMTVNATPIWANMFANFVDSGNGVGVYWVAPEIQDLGNVYQVEFVVTDPSGLADTLITNLRVVTFLRGDLDANNRYTMNDLAWLISYLFRDGPEPAVIEAADVDKSLDINIGDVTYLIKFLYYSGPQPPQ